MKEIKRSAGILLHIISLPSPYGIGDLGYEARSFADFLKRSGQSYWQILPINPTEAGQGHSPYSSVSGRAGNPLLISPDLLAEDGLLDRNEIAHLRLPVTAKLNYSEAAKLKLSLFEKAWNKFNEINDHTQRRHFEAFCKVQADWLDDFALYMLLKQHYDHQPWYSWPQQYKLRNNTELEKLTQDNAHDILKIKWLQFIFLKQWEQLKAYCHGNGVKFIGDLPFYVSYDSVDVWSNRDIFCVDETGKMTGMAGVPPDAFSNDGQLWGMPVFNWNAVKQQDYEWWIKRLKKNIELFDLLRLDHFRAFAAYWEVPAHEKTAQHGRWKPGPATALFDALEKKLGNLPFIAEDLGDIDEPVYNLRDRYCFPGMKVLQFAFGNDMPRSTFIPHNYGQNFVAYTGTHDNNTTRGWFRQEGRGYRHQIEQYFGSHITEENIHQHFIRCIYGSVANLAVIPMQDVLGLDENARMNTPSLADENWSWRLLTGQISHAAENYLREMVSIFNR